MSRKMAVVSLMTFVIGMMVGVVSINFYSYDRWLAKENQCLEVLYNTSQALVVLREFQIAEKDQSIVKLWKTCGYLQRTISVLAQEKGVSARSLMPIPLPANLGADLPTATIVKKANEIPPMWDKDYLRKMAEKGK